MSHQWSAGHRFEGRVALVTGAGGTLGGAIARSLGREGARVVVGYRDTGDILVCRLSTGACQLAVRGNRHTAYAVPMAD